MLTHHPLEERAQSVGGRDDACNPICTLVAAEIEQLA